MANISEGSADSEYHSSELCADRLVIVLEAVEQSTANSKEVTLGAANLVPRCTDSNTPAKRRPLKANKKLSSNKRSQPMGDGDERRRNKKRSKWMIPAYKDGSVATADSSYTGTQALSQTQLGLNNVGDPAAENFAPSSAVDFDTSPGTPKQINCTSSPKLLERSLTTDVESDLEGSSWQPSDEQDNDAEWNESRSRRRPFSSRQRTSSRQATDSRASRSNKQLKEIRNSSSLQKDDLTTGTTHAQLDDSRCTSSDDYCWICHKVGQMVICSYCPRVYHPACLCMDRFPETWLCPECQDLLVSECVWYQQPNWRNVTQERVQRMLCFLINRLSIQQWAEHFREPVDTEKVVGYSDLIAYPMDLRTLYERNKAGRYASAQAFLGDFRWILHDCTIFNGTSSLLTSHARILDRACQRELALMKACPVCYENRMVAMFLLPSTSTTLPLLTANEWLPTFVVGKVQSDSATRDDGAVDQSAASTDATNSENVDPWWFTKLCNQVHPLVWVRLLHYPLWPGKVMAVDGNNLLVSFFGDYDVIVAPAGSAQLHSLARAGRSLHHASESSATAPLESLGSPSSVDSSRTPPQSVLSSVIPTSTRFSKSTDHSSDANYKRAVAELDYHVSLLQAHFPKFKLPAVSVEFNRGHVNRFYKCCSEIREIGPSSKKAKINSVADTCSQTTGSTIPLDNNSQSGRVEKSGAIGPYPEPLLTRMADSLRGSFKNTSAEERINKSSVLDPSTALLMVESHAQQPGKSASHTDVATTSASGTQMDVSEGQLPGQSGVFQHEVLTVLHPLPENSLSSPASDGDEVHRLFDKFRSQINETLKSLEEKWRMTRSTVATTGQQSNEPPILSPVTTEKQIQTLQDDVTERGVGREAKQPVGPVEQEESHGTTPPALTGFQAVMMESEIHRLDRENQRLNLLLAFTRAEMALEMRNRITELRRVWNFEISAILEAASKIWEQDVIRIVDAVKRKQWCAYCGRLAYYYCCWNTCYCNNVCQSKHWASHINVCVQARSKNKIPPNTASSREVADLQQLQRQQQQNPLASLPQTAAQTLPSSSQTRWPKGVGP
ncbi:Protein kinase C-binding protein 1 [Clonorchis sinensis]|uniref:Protein kinase C-binding protein 1 n=1 Tax=Clonorchis sinensis TaxID=79923 RepID=A0A419QAJ0_CLOSI|nr:Protein kinase C-binding protein 1 [Clonorchis sinensis]